MQTVIQTNQLTKMYQQREVLSRLDFKLVPGEICAIIGKNGAGKSTFFKLLAHEIFPTSGRFYLYDKDNNHQGLSQKRFGFLIEHPKFYGHLSAYQNLKYLAKLRGITDLNRVDEVLADVDLIKVKKRKVGSFSMGMKQRLGIAQALLHHPDCLVLDEPTNGLDAKGIADIRHLLLKLNKEYGITILISSHILSELKRIAQRFVFLRDGQKIEDVSKSELDEKLERYLLLKAEPLEKTVRLLESNFQGIQYTVLPERMIRIESHIEQLHDINQCLVNHNIQINEFRIEHIDLEQYFLGLEEVSHHA